MKFTSLLSNRLKSDKPQKMHDLASKSTSGGLSSFSGVFEINEITGNERTELERILIDHNENNRNVVEDLETLMGITSESKAINNQAVMLHGERIKRAHDLLMNYREGAFSSWMIGTYGNRQTPYNFMQYYLFYNELDEEMQEEVDEMPKQVIYTLSTRKAEKDEKIQFIKENKGETKNTLLDLIRHKFPLSDADKRTPSKGYLLVTNLKRCLSIMHSTGYKLNPKERKEVSKLLLQLQNNHGE